MVSVSKRVYVDDPAQPSRPSSTSNAVISVANQHHIFFEEIGGREPIPLEMTVHNPILLGLKGYEELDLNTFFERMLTACNLHIKHMRLSTVAADTEPVRVHWGRSRDEEAVGTRAMLALYGTEKLDESQVLVTLKIMNTVYADPDPSTRVANLKASLESYYHGIVSHHRDEVFKGLYVALEKAVNFDNDIAGAEFDSKAHTLVGNLRLEINRIRKACDRLKHHSSEKQLLDYPDHTAVFWFIKELRPVAANAILLRLKELAGRP